VQTGRLFFVSTFVAVLLDHFKQPSECVGFDPPILFPVRPPRHRSNAERIKNKPFIFNDLRLF